MPGERRTGGPILSPGLAGPVAAAGCLVLSLALVAYLVAGAPPAGLPLPFGLAGGPAVLALDGLAAVALLALLPPAAAALLTRPTGLPAVALAALALLAADAATLALALAGGALALLRPAAGRRRPHLLPLGLAAGTLLLVAAALALAGTDPRFAALRARPPAGAATLLLPAAALAAATLAAGLPPLHRWQARRAAIAGPLLPALAAPLALALPARLLFDLAGPSGPPWWGAALALAGAAGALAAAWRATRSRDLARIAAAAGAALSGLALAALGIALGARAADIGPLAAQALAAALLLLLTHAWGGGLLALAAGAVQAGAGTRRLDLLGGLVHRMPATSAALLAAALATAALPPGPGFPALWRLLEAAHAAPRIGPGWTWIALAVTLAAATAAGLLLLAMLRLVGVALLGRPRTPRVAAAEEVAAAPRRVLLALAALVLAAGALPPAALRLVAPAVRQFAGASAPAAILPTLLAGLFAATLAAAALLPRGRGGPAWEGGAPPPPDWLPFGDPATQPGPAAFTPPWPMPRLRAPFLRRRRPIPRLALPALPLLIAALALAWAATR